MSGNRPALLALVARLGREVETSKSLRDRLPLVRAYLAAVARLEAVDEAALTEERRRRAEAATAPSEAPAGPLDELLERRRRRARHA